VLAAMGQLSWAIALGVLWALGLGYGFYRFLCWRHAQDAQLHPGSAFFAAAIGGASEMALLAERHGAQVERVAAAHSLRVLLVVSVIPLALQLSGLHGLDAMAPAVREVHPTGLALLVALTVAASLGMRWLDLPSPFVLGALLVTLGLTANGVVLSALPQLCTNAGQLFIGVALGTRFSPAFMRSGPRWLLSVAMGTLGMMGLSAGFAWLLAQATGLHPATLVLGTSPGGIAEMSITAKVLQLGVPMVTAFHVVRYLAVLLLTGKLWRLEAKRLGAAAAATGESCPRC
jgi:membrane AbrB-like protein